MKFTKMHGIGNDYVMLIVLKKQWKIQVKCQNLSATDILVLDLMG